MLAKVAFTFSHCPSLYIPSSKLIKREFISLDYWYQHHKMFMLPPNQMAYVKILHIYQQRKGKFPKFTQFCFFNLQLYSFKDILLGSVVPITSNYIYDVDHFTEWTRPCKSKSWGIFISLIVLTWLWEVFCRCLCDLNLVFNK